MAITNLEVIESALRDINVIAVGETASSAQGSKSLLRLNMMMEQFKEDEIDVGYFAQSATTGNCPIPDWSHLSIISLLAIHLAPAFGASISQELAVIAGDAANTLARKMQVERMEGADMSHIPIGQGHYGRGYDIAKGE